VLFAVGLQGYRGLIASVDLSPGDVVVSVPLHNILQVPRQLTTAAAAAAAAMALEAWQQQHGALPEPLLNLILGGEVWCVVCWVHACHDCFSGCNSELHAACHRSCYVSCIGH
jgi:hypothetical protein